MTEPVHAVETTDLANQSQRLGESPASCQAGEIASLYEMALALNSVVDLDERLRVVLQQIRRVLDYDVCYISLATADALPGSETLRVRAVDGEGAERLLGVEVPIDHGINAWIYREGKPVLVGDADTDPRRLHIRGRTEPVGAAVGAPLIVVAPGDHQTIGTIYAGRRQPHTFTEAHLNFLAIAAVQVAAAVQQTWLLDQARWRAAEMETLADVQGAHQSAVEERDKLAHLHRVVADVQGADDLVAKLQIIADGMRKLGWGRVSVSLRDADLNMIGLACAGFAPEDEAALRANPLPGSEWKKRFAEQFDRFRIGTCYYLPWDDAWVRENVRGVMSHMPEPAVSPVRSGGVAAIESWHPQDLLYIPLYGRETRIVGIIGLDDPQDGRRPTAQSLHIIELFAHEAALAIENAKLLADLKLVNTDLQEMVTAQAHLLQAIEEMITALNPEGGIEILRLVGKEPACA